MAILALLCLKWTREETKLKLNSVKSRKLRLVRKDFAAACFRGPRVISCYGSVVVLNCCDIVIRQDDDTFLGEPVQEERQFGPHFYHQDVEVCASRSATAVTVGAGSSVLCSEEVWEVTLAVKMRRDVYFATSHTTRGPGRRQERCADETILLGCG